MASTLDYRQLYPDMTQVSRRLFAGATNDRLPIDEYAQTLKRSGRFTPPVEEAVEKAREVRDITRVVCYIAGALTGVDEQTKSRYEKVNRLLEGYGDITTSGRDVILFFGYVPHLHGTDPVKHPNVTPSEVRDIDYLWANIVADFHINFLNPTAHGNAIEEGWAETWMIPAIFLNLEGNNLSRLARGMNNVMKLINYNDFLADGIERLRSHLDEFAVWLKTFPNRDPREFYYFHPQLIFPAVLRERGFDPRRGVNPVGPVIAEKWSSQPCFPPSDLLVYNRRSGQVGTLESHDVEMGVYHVEFGNRQRETMLDGDADILFWLK